MLLKPHVVFAGGGALGNLYPGLAVAEQLSANCPEIEITFLGCGESFERHEVQTAGHQYTAVPSQASPRNPLECIRFVSDNAAGYVASRWLLGEGRATLVVGLGGPVSAVACRAAYGRGIPFVLIEANSAASRTARTLGAHADAVCLAFEETQAQLPVRAPAAVTGTPVRPGFVNGGAGLAGEKLLTVIAGRNATHARSLNASTPRVLSRLRQAMQGWRVIHQAGEGQLQTTERFYRSSGVDALVVTHVDEMADLLAESDLIVCRAGGSILAELGVTGRPAVVAPSTASADSSCASNAELLSQAGACEFVDERSTEPLVVGLERSLRALLSDDLRRAGLARAIESWANPHAAADVAALCAEALGLGQLQAAA